MSDRQSADPPRYCESETHHRAYILCLVSRTIDNVVGEYTCTVKSQHILATEPPALGTYYCTSEREDTALADTRPRRSNRWNPGHAVVLVTPSRERGSNRTSRKFERVTLTCVLHKKNIQANRSAIATAWVNIGNRRLKKEWIPWTGKLRKATRLSCLVCPSSTKRFPTRHQQLLSLNSLQIRPCKPRSTALRRWNPVVGPSLISLCTVRFRKKIYLRWHSRAVAHMLHHVTNLRSG